MQEQDRIYIPPKRTPHLPPLEDVNNTETMLGATVIGIIMALVVGVIIYAVRSH